jgi:nicotinamide mononucleotide transporter
MIEKNLLIFEQNQQIVLEIIAAMLTTWCVILAAKNKILNWPVSMIASVFYFLIFYKNHFFSDAYLQIAFLIFQTYGWWYWSSLNLSKKEKEITHIPPKFAIKLFVLTTIVYVLWLFFYKKINPTARIPEIDALTTVISLSALYMQVKHWVESWIVWIVVDLIYIPMYLYGNQKITAVLYLLLAAIAIKGYFDWKRIFSNQIKKEGKKPSLYKI